MFSFFKKILKLFKIIKILDNWQDKYRPSQYDKVISDVYELIDEYDLKSGEISPKFVLPNDQLQYFFIKQFFKTAKEKGYEVISKPSQRKDYTIFNLKKI